MAGVNVGLAVVAAILAAGGLLSLWWRTRMGGEIALMAATATSKAADVAKLAPGTLVEVKGTLRCAQPLTAEFSKQACVYFKAEIERDEVWYDTDSQGKQRRNTRKVTLHSNIQHAPCLIEDDSGRVAVDLEGAEIEAPQVVYAVGLPGGNAAADVITSVTQLVSDQTIRHFEYALAVDIPAYLLGEVKPGGTIGKPAKGAANKTFVISHKSEEERAKDIGSTMTLVFWLAIVLFAAAAGVLVWAFIKGPL
jgi:hypothetical protein